MELNQHQKKIIDAIRDKNVFDITSYLSEFQYTKSFSDASFKKTLSLGEHKYEYDFSTPQIIGSDLSGIFDFLFVWQSLKNNGLLLESEKAITPQDLSIFFTKQTDEEHDLKFNKEFFKTCQDKIGLRIIPAPGIQEFIKRDYRTAGELISQRTLRAARAAVVVGLIFLIASAVFYVVLNFGAIREASYILNQMGVLQEDTNTIGKAVTEIKNEITGISDKINTFLP